MSVPHKRPAAPFEVENPAVAFHKLEDFTRKILSVPKKRIDAKLEKEKAGKRKSRRDG